MTATTITAAGASDSLAISSGNDGTLVIQSGPTGSKVNAITLASSGAMTLNTPMQGGSLTSATAQATTSGTSIDFTSIPSWVKRITVMFSGVSTNGTSNYQIQVGAGSVLSSGYTSAASQLNSSSMSTGSVSTGMAVTFSTTAAAALYSGSLVMTLVGSNTWSFTSSVGSSTGVAYVSAGASPALGGALDRVRLTTVSGDTFDAGSVNIMYEG